MRTCHVADPVSIPGRDKFLGEVFRGVSSHVTKTTDTFRPPQDPEYHLVIIIILLIFALLE